MSENAGADQRRLRHHDDKFLIIRTQNLPNHPTAKFPNSGNPNTIRLDGVAVRSCLLLAVQADGCAIETVEGLAANGELHPLQKAFREHHALQCGFCTSGILMSLAELWPRRDQVSRDEIIDCLGGHLCRCTGYVGIVRAAEDAFGLPAGDRG